MIANDSLFLAVYVLSLLLHYKKYFITWNILDEKDVTE
jgi:hypothetical protein